MNRAALALTAILVIVLCLLWTAQRPATPEPLTVAWRESDDGVTFA